MAKLLEIFEREDGALSMLRIFAAIAFLTLIVLTYLELIINRSVPHYGEFATFTITLIGISAGKSVAEVKAGMRTPPKGGSI